MFKEMNIWLIVLLFYTKFLILLWAIKHRNAHWCMYIHFNTFIFAFEKPPKNNTNSARYKFWHLNNLWYFHYLALIKLAVSALNVTINGSYRIRVLHLTLRYSFSMSLLYTSKLYTSVIKLVLTLKKYFMITIYHLTLQLTSSSFSSLLLFWFPHSIIVGPSRQLFSVKRL